MPVSYYPLHTELPHIGKRMKAINKVFLGQENKGRGRYFKSRFIEAGLVQYDFGLCLLTKENLDKFVQGFVGCPVIIDHNEVYDNNAEDLRVGAVSRVWFDETDGYYWCEGIIWDEKALDLILNKGWSVSCQYDITEIDEQGGIHNGIEFDKTILNGSFEHLALVDAPRYEAALIAVNSVGKKKFLYNKAINANFKEEEHPRGDDGKFTDGNNTSFYNENSKTIELKGNELGSTDEEIRENGLKYFKENYQGKKFDNPELKGILFSNPGIKKFYTNSADINKIKAIPALKDIIEKGEYQGSEDLAHPRQDGIIKFHRINHNVSIDGHKENMSVLIGEDKNGNKFYNLNHRTYTAENSSRGERAIGVANEEFHINILTHNLDDFNPDITKHKAQNSKETDMGIIEDLEKLILKARNKGENMKSKNEDVDKRKILREADAIAMKPASEFDGGEEEKFRTLTKKLEELSYDKSETGTADNKAKNEDEDDKDKEEAKNKCRNEEDEEEKSKNKRGKNEDDEEEDEEKEDEYDKLKREVDDEAKNKAKNKARNSINEFKNSFYDYNSGSYGTGYISQKKAIELGKQTF